MENEFVEKAVFRDAQIWWQRCAPDERAYWGRQAGSCQPVDAWQAYRRVSVSPPYTLHTLNTPCPACKAPSIEALDFPDGRATYCPQCGYRSLESDWRR